MNLSELKYKEEQILRLLERKELGAIVLRSTHNFAWLTGGRDNHVLFSPIGEAAIVVSKDGAYVVTSNIEARRIRDEELAGLPFDLRSFGWYRSNLTKAIKELVGDKRIGSDTMLSNAIYVEDELRELRLTLTEEEIQRLKKLGGETSKCIEAVCKDIKPGMSELSITGEVSRELFQRNIVPSLIMVAADERVYKYRHPISKGNKVKKHCMVVVVGQRFGLNVALTRVVHFGDLPEELKERHKAVTHVDAALILSSVPGVSAGEIFRKGIQAYERNNFPNEWMLHHQGGWIGYQPREIIVTEDMERKVGENQAMAWNPSITGTKSEDTILVGKEPEIVTRTLDWPEVICEFEGKRIARPDILII